MTSASLSFLRTVPDEQASIYNTYLPKATKVRQDVMISGVAKLAQLGALVKPAQSGLQDLQQRTNDAEKKVLAATTGQDQTPDDACMQKVRYALSLGLGIADICQGLVADNDIGGFLALNSLIPWLARACKLPNTHKNMSASAFDRVVNDNLDLIAAYHKQLMTPAQLAQVQEVQECTISMPLVRQNFQQLQNFFELQLQPSAVAGMFKRVDRLYRWQGLPNDASIQKGFITLVDDVDSRSLSAPYMVRR